MKILADEYGIKPEKQKANIGYGKLEWSEYVDEFVEAFYPLTELDAKNNRQLEVLPNKSRTQIFALLYELFWIPNQKYPDQEILFTTLRTNVASYARRRIEKKDTQNSEI